MKYTNQVSSSEPAFYYHSDHLGSASYITDSAGNETQHLVYLPYGEDWVDKKYNVSQYETLYKFNGKEKDQETGYNNYGARYYNDWASIWLSVDPLSDKYPHLTSYNYCANNPVMLIDPDGRDIELTFYKGKNNESSKKEFDKIVNSGLEGQFETYYTKGKNGGSLMQLRATKGGGDKSKMSESGLALYEELSSMINNHNTTAQVDVKYGSSDITTGNYINNAIDIADIMQFNNSGINNVSNVGASKAGKLIHELVEQFGKASDGVSKGSNQNYNKNHQIGIQAENRINGNTRGRDYQTGRGIVTTQYTEKNGTISNVIINTNPSIISVKQPKPRGRLR